MSDRLPTRFLKCQPSDPFLSSGHVGTLDSFA
jgi:hypothetical protein